MASLSLATANWAMEMLRRVGKPTDDVFLSPVSVTVALGMAYAGAENVTKQQFNNVLFDGLTEKEVHEGFDRLVVDLNSPKNGYKLQTANKLFGQEGYGLLPEFVKLLKNHYHSELKTVDFKTNADAAACQINKWVEEVTMRQIKDLIAPRVLTPETRLVLVNAIYFKGDWKNKFDVGDTTKQSFFSAADEQSKVDMMRKKDDFLYYETDEAQVLGMQYMSDDLGMFVFLPKEKFGLENFAKGLTGQTLLDLITRTRQTKVEVSLPKFKLSCQFQLSNHLKAMGLVDAFSGDDADFSRMTGNRDLYISAVIHKAFVEINEEGSEAAAATAAECRSRSSSPQHQQIVFTADHPFVFAIYSSKHKQLYFLGRATNPTTSECTASSSIGGAPSSKKRPVASCERRRTDDTNCPSKNRRR